MRAPQAIFYGFASFCLGLIAVASGGFRALANLVGYTDVDTIDRLGVIATIAVSFLILTIGVVAAATPDRNPGE